MLHFSWITIITKLPERSFPSIQVYGLSAEQNNPPITRDISPFKINLNFATFKGR